MDQSSPNQQHSGNSNSLAGSNQMTSLSEDENFDKGYKKRKMNPNSLKDTDNQEIELNLLDIDTLRVTMDTKKHLIQKSFSLSHLQPEYIEIIENKANQFRLYYKLVPNTLQAVADKSVMLEFSSWLYEFLDAVLLGDYGSEKVRISSFYKIYEQDILSKAKELNILCNVKDNQIMVSGLRHDLNEFKNYLRQVDRSLYPKYWNFEETSMYSEFEVSSKSAEFNEIADKMKETIADVEITKLIRIQNNYHMEPYISNLVTKREEEENNGSRQLLFHGTRNVIPSVICRSFNIGFDRVSDQDREIFRNQMHFAVNAGYSHTNAYKLDPSEGKFQMILADVFLGKSYDFKGYLSSPKIPQGFDSMCFNETYYIINSNSYIYPLYLIEYKTKASTRFEPNFFFSLGLTNLPETPVIPSNFSANISVDPPLNLFKHLKIEQTESRKTLSANSLKRIQKELIEIQTDSSLENFFISLPEDNDVSKWTVHLLGPADTPYEAGIFKLQVIFPPDYPAVSPQLAFQTQIYHPCVDDSGGMCLGLLTHWTPITSMRHVLLTVLAMLDNPGMEQSIMGDILTQYQQDRRGFEAKARAWTEKFANIN